jgi:sigma-E factor negative regulatory protein RseB
MRLTQLSGVCLMGVAVLAHADDDWLVVKSRCSGKAIATERHLPASDECLSGNLPYCASRFW